MRRQPGRPSAMALAIVLWVSALVCSAAAAEYTITIDKMKFGPAPTTLRVGDTIVWQNKDIFEHTATARDKSFDVKLAVGAEARTTLQAPGEVAFYCRFHPGMTGTLVVAP